MPTIHEWTALRETVDQSIERHRQGQARLHFVGPDGAPIEGLEVEIAQKTRYLLFGNLAFDLVSNAPPHRPELFKRRFLELFNLAIFPQEFDPKVRQRFFDLVRELRRRGAPVSGIGVQMHPVNHWLWPQAIWDTLEMCAELDCPIHITELHQPAWDQPVEGGWRTGGWTPEAQAEFLAQVYRLCFGHPSVVSINYWGLSDREIWIPGAGLIDAEYHPKPAFQTLKRLIKGEWLPGQKGIANEGQGSLRHCRGQQTQ
jgi:hypothetical protein